MGIKNWLKKIGIGGERKLPGGGEQLPVDNTSSTIAGSRTAVDYLLNALRSAAPGAWSDNRLEQTNHFVGCAFLAINTLMKQAASSELCVWKRDPQDPEHKQRMGLDDPLVQLLMNPNNQDDYGMNMRRTVQQIGLTGSCLSWQVPNSFPRWDMPEERNQGQPSEMYVIPTALATPIPQYMGYPQGAYRVQPLYPYGPFATLPNMASAAGAVVDARQFFVMRNPHPLLRYDGYSDLTAMRLQADTVDSIDRARWTTQQKGVEPAGILSLPTKPDGTNFDPDDPEVARIRNQIEEFWANPMNRGKFLIIGGGAEATPWGHAPMDMAWQEGWEQLVSFILASYGVMKSVAGASDDATYAQLYAALKQFHLMTLNPLLHLISGAWNKHLCPQFGPEYFVTIEPERIDDPTVRQGDEGHSIRIGDRTINEWRKQHGLEETPEPWGNERVGSRVMTIIEAKQAEQQLLQAQLTYEQGQFELEQQKMQMQAQGGATDDDVQEVIRALTGQGGGGSEVSTEVKGKEPTVREEPINKRGQGENTARRQKGEGTNPVEGERPRNPASTGSMQPRTNGKVM